MKPRFSLVPVMFAVLLSQIFSACDKCSDTVDAPLNSPIAFSIVDSMGNSLVNSARSQYSIDSVKLFDTDGKTNTIHSHMNFPDTDMHVFYADCNLAKQGKSSLILQLNNQDADTLDVWYSRINKECFFLYEYTRFQLNGKDLSRSPSTQALQIVKPD